MHLKTYIVCALFLFGCSPSEVRQQVSYCEKLDQVQRFICYEKAAREYKETWPCNTINNPGVRTRCIVNVAKDACDEDVCSAIGEFWKEESCREDVLNYVLCTQ